MEIRDEIEDFLDSLIGEQGVSLSSHFSVGSLKRKRSAVEGVKEMRDKLSVAIQPLEGFLRQPSDSPHVIPRRRYPTQPDNFREEFIVGLKEDVEAYVADLVPTEANHGSSTDLAIFGMGGSGKTTATRLVYNHKQISEHFDRRAWVCVSQTWDKNQLLRQICQQVRMQPPNDDDDEMLILNLKEFLQSHSCFFVLDDVWEVKALRELLPPLRSRSSNNGGKAPSRVLVTTRNKEILSFPQNDFSAKKIRPLTLEESYDLFSKTIRRNRRDVWNLEAEFEKLGKEMLEKCRGLPLAIVALGGLLSSRDMVPEWESIKADVVRRISNHMGSDDDYGVVKEILELSYFDLPYYLKPCFIYLGIFPEDSKIDVKTLIQLWIAEGFVKVDQNSFSTTLETLARDFLDELAHRCMVEIDEKDSRGVISSIRIHDLMRDLCTHKAKDWKFFVLLPPPSSTTTFVDQNSCRIILPKQSSTSTDIMRFRARSTKIRLRSYIMLQLFSTISIRLSLSTVQMKYLQVLCLIEVELKDTRTGTKIGDLILLRHLELKSCRVSRGHALSIKKLRNLLSFIYEGVGFENCGRRLNLVSGMQHLRHLRIRSSGVEELGLGNIYNLQTFDSYGGEWVTKELPHASPGLKELTLRNISSSAQLEGVYEFFNNPCEHLLQTLELNLPICSVLEFNLHRLKLPRHCASLDLRGKIQTQPHQPFGQFPHSLLKLCLYGSKIGDEEQFKAALAQLEELKYLYLYFDAYTGDKLSMAGLPKLQELYLEYLSNLKEWRIESGALCKLQKMEISFCEDLERLPQQISCISSLKHLRLCNMPRTFAGRLQRPSEYDAEGEDFHLVRHIPSLEFSMCNYEN